MVDTDDTRRTTDDGRRTTPWVWHKLPTGELIKKMFCCYLVSEIGILDNMRAELSSDYRNFEYYLRSKGNLSAI